MINHKKRLDMTPREYEEYVGNYFKEQGYKIELTPQSGDYGLDVFAYKEHEKIAIQAKMYGNSTRKVNRQMIMELQGAKEYFDCTKAILATDGEVMPDAKEVASKLGIEILIIQAHTDIPKPQVRTVNTQKEELLEEYSFDNIWEKYIFPLKGKTLHNSRGINQITDVDWSGISRITSKGNDGRIDIETFKMAINKLLTEKVVTRDYINQNSKRVSSGVILILSQVPFFKLEEKPLRLIFTK